jgi:hypothetical protein
MKKLIPAVCVALFALSGTAVYAQDDKKKAEPAKAAASKPAAASASAPAAKAAPAATTASAPAKKKEKKGGC